MEYYRFVSTIDRNGRTLYFPLKFVESEVPDIMTLCVCVCVFVCVFVENLSCF